MRASSIVLVALAGSALLCVGCGQMTSPTRPTSASIGASDASAPGPVSTVAPHQVPFKGTLQGTDTDSDPTPTSVVVTTDGTGTATELGQFSFRERVTVSFATLTAAGTSHWQAANGDSLDTALTGSGQPTGTPDELRITETHTITGGTGRFAGAQGRFTVDRLASETTFATSGSFAGTITVPGARD